MNKTIEEKFKNGREYRNLILKNIEVREGDQEQFIVEGYATTYNQDYPLWEEDDYKVFERINPKAFEKCDMGDVIFQYNHEGRVFARTSNGTLTLTSDEHGLKVRADLSGTETGRQLYEEIKGGYTNKMSFGFIVKSDSITNNRDGESYIVTREILEISKLYDVSAVSIPANDYTSISARNFSEGVIDEVKKEIQASEEKRRIIENIKKLCGVEI